MKGGSMKDSCSLNYCKIDEEGIRHEI